MSAKRSDYISWDEYFMGVAHLSGMRSKDPNTQVGACIVSPDNKILSMGYNGFPKGCSDDEFPWERENDKDSNLTKYPFVTHSELNAILNYRGGSLEGTKLYVSLFPCNECAKAIIQAGIHTVVYDSDKYRGTPSNRAARRMFDAAGVECVPYSRTGRTIHIGASRSEATDKRSKKVEAPTEDSCAACSGDPCRSLFFRRHQSRSYQ